MLELNSPESIALLQETVELECKLAQGRDGQGGLPKDFWPTYSAMANSHGGVVLLGVREQERQFRLEGVGDAERIKTDLFNNLNNREKVSANLLSDADVTTHVINGLTLLKICIPPANRKQKPVFINGQPLGNTYRRLHEGDRKCDDETVKRMLAEQLEDERDARIFEHFGLDDIDPESLRIYRQMLRDEKPSHPFLELDDFNFLSSLRGWRRDRETGKCGLTLAGLLMFGRWSAIQEAVPGYFVDYQERPEAKAELRWVDRLVPDGTWTGNLFEFYRRVYRKLIADLKVPFALKDGQRQDDTPVHAALREALVNTLVHADYSGRVSVLVVKRPDMFGFRNPGGLRLPIEQVLKGGESDCRNRILHQMFLMIGLGERGGSGIPRIYSGWKSRNWRPPVLHEKDEPEQTLLELHMLDLLPASVVEELRLRFGDAIDALGRVERLILATAAIEQVVNHSRLIEICDIHPHDLSQCLNKLERDGLLSATGQSRGKVYHLPGEVMISPDQVFSAGLEGRGHSEPSSGYNVPSSGHNAPSSGYSDPSSGHNTQRPEAGAGSARQDSPPASERDAQGCLISPHLDAPVVDDLNQLCPELLQALEALAAAPREKERLAPEVMEAVIVAVCRDRYFMLNALAKLLKRNPDTLRKSYMDKLVKARKIRRAFPATPNHEKQSYRAVSEGVT